MVNLDRCNQSCNILDDLSNKICVSNKTKNLNLSLSGFDMITRINKSETPPKHVSWKCKCKCDCRICNPDQNWNNNKCR